MACREPSCDGPRRDVQRCERRVNPGHSMSRPLRSIPPLAARLAEGRPVLAHRQVTELAERVLGMTRATTVAVRVTHTANVMTRMANNQVLSGDDGDTLN